MMWRAFLFFCLLLIPLTSVARAEDDGALDALLQQLQEVEGAAEAQALDLAIQLTLSQSDSPTATLIYDRSLEVLNEDDTVLAEELLSRLVELQPDFAQGWYQHAMVKFLADDYEAALSGLERALEIEPRHYMALVGAATILEAYGRKRSALGAVTRAEELNPYIEGISTWRTRLEREVLGQGI